MLPDRNSLAMIKGLAGDLALFLEKGPANSAALQYLGAMYLLAKDLEGFKALVEKYYGTEFLPVLPVHFQEAVIVMSEKVSMSPKQLLPASPTIKSRCLRTAITVLLPGC